MAPLFRKGIPTNNIELSSRTVVQYINGYSTELREVLDDWIRIIWIPPSVIEVSSVEAIAHIVNLLFKYI